MKNQGDRFLKTELSLRETLLLIGATSKPNRCSDGHFRVH